jgi:hypothetical protein
MGESIVDQNVQERTDNPDHFLVGAVSGRLKTDGGPRYKETPLEEVLTGPNPPYIAEPYNAATAALFILIAVIWGWRVLKAGVRNHPFVASCLPILLVGGIGGTLYHASRSQFIYFLLDVIPISLLGLAGSIYLLVRIGSHAGWQRLVGYGLGAISVYLFLNGFLFRGLLKSALAHHPQLTVNLSYASLAAIVIIPLIFVLVRTRFRHGTLVAGAIVSFGIAWFCRLVDQSMMTDLPMGTHWLWHLFGALTTAMMIEYFFRLEQEEV